MADEPQCGHTSIDLGSSPSDGTRSSHGPGVAGSAGAQARARLPPHRRTARQLPRRRFGDGRRPRHSSLATLRCQTPNRQSLACGARGGRGGSEFEGSRRAGLRLPVLPGTRATWGGSRRIWGRNGRGSPRVFISPQCNRLNAATIVLRNAVRECVARLNKEKPVLLPRK